MKETGDILIVDDSPENIVILDNYLREENFNVRSVINAESAFKAIDKKIPDLILLDIMMLGMTGYEVCEILKSDDKTKDIPIIFLTSLSSALNKVKAFELGGVDYITKPFESIEVVARVKTHLKLKKYSEKMEKYNHVLNDLNKLLRQENKSMQDLLKMVKELFTNIIMNDLPLIKFVTSILQKNEKYILETATGVEEEDELFRVLSKITEPLKTVSTDIEQIIQIFLTVGFISKDAISKIDIKKTSFFHVLFDIYKKGGFSTELFQQFLSVSQLDLEMGSIELF